jgi:hypothetical protein
MITEKTSYRLIAVVTALAVLALITAVTKNVIGFNAITVALLYLLVVLAASAMADLAGGMVVAVASGFLVNFYFLPPFGTFYIEAPEDWVSFVAYTVTAMVISHFSATVRRRAEDAGQLQAQLSRHSRFVASLITRRKEDLTLDLLANELKTAYAWSYCAIYLFGNTGGTNPVSAGTRPPQSSLDGRVPPRLPTTLLEVIREDEPDARYLTLKDQGETLGVLVVTGQLPPSAEGTELIAALVTLVVRQTGNDNEHDNNNDFRLTK